MSYQGHGNPTRRGVMQSGQRSPAPFRGPPPPGWGSPVLPYMTQSPPPFLIRPMVGRGSAPNTRTGSPIPFAPPRWSPGRSGSPGPIPTMPSPGPFLYPRDSPIPILPPPPFHGNFMPHEGFPLQPSYDMEFVYPPGVDPEMFNRQASVQSDTSQQEGLTTAEIIAAQSQDYIDEKLAEYQATIQHLQACFHQAQFRRTGISLTTKTEKFP